jgi:hypothetical protein
MSYGQYDTIIVFLLVLIFVKLYFPKLISNFSMNMKPYSYDIQGTGNEPSDFFKLPVDLKCTPGPSKDSSYYSTETSGGICGDGQFVNQQMKNYKIM